MVLKKAYLKESQQSLSCGEGLLTLRPTPKLEDRLRGSPRLLIQYIRSYPSYLEAVSPIRNLGTRHAVRSGTHKLSTVIGNLSFENVEKFRYLGVTVTNTNDIRVEIKRRIGPKYGECMLLFTWENFIVPSVFQEIES